MRENDPNAPKRSALAAWLMGGAVFALALGYHLAVTFIDHTSMFF